MVAALPPAKSCSATVAVTVDAGTAGAVTVRVAVIVEAGAGLAVTVSVVRVVAVVVAVVVTVVVAVDVGVASAWVLEPPWLARATMVMIPATAHGNFADFFGDWAVLCALVRGMSFFLLWGIALHRASRQ